MGYFTNSFFPGGKPPKWSWRKIFYNIILFIKKILANLKHITKHFTISNMLKHICSLNFILSIFSLITIYCLKSSGLSAVILDWLVDNTNWILNIDYNIENKEIKEWAISATISLFIRTCIKGILEAIIADWNIEPKDLIPNFILDLNAKFVRDFLPKFTLNFIPGFIKDLMSRIKEFIGIFFSSSGGRMRISDILNPDDTTQPVRGPNNPPQPVGGANNPPQPTGGPNNPPQPAEGANNVPQVHTHPESALSPVQITVNRLTANNPYPNDFYYKVHGGIYQVSTSDGRGTSQSTKDNQDWSLYVINPKNEEQYVRNLYNAIQYTKKSMPNRKLGLHRLDEEAYNYIESLDSAKLPTDATKYVVGLLKAKIANPSTLYNKGK